MKQYTTPAQTAKLIELGFRLPKSKVGGKVIYEPDADLEIEWEEAYSIGDLIEMLPTSIRKKGYDCFLYIEPNIGWDVGYMRYNIEFNQRAIELIDALYDMIIKLKKEEVI